MRSSTIAVRVSSTGRRTDGRPWYRQPWLWFLVALPAASIAFSVFTLYVALAGSDSVVPHEGDSTSYSAPRAPAENGR